MFVLLNALAASAQDAAPTESAKEGETAKLLAGEAIYTKIVGLLNDGKVESAMKLMTATAREDFVSIALEVVAERVAAGKEISVDLPDRVTVKALLADIGLDTFEFPKWYAGDGDKPSDEEWDAVDRRLVSLIEKAPDQGKALHALYLLHEAIEPSDFGGMMVAPPGGWEPAANRVWVELSAEDESAVFPLQFRHSRKRGWRYDGWDWDALEIEDRKFVECEDIAIAGKTHDGKEIKLEDYLGKVVLIDFWGTW
jgi:hypothetical protein